MIKIEKGSLAYESEQVLSDINLEVAEGEFVVVCGASGCGKSSLIRILNGLIPELYEGELEGDFIVNNKKLPTADFPNFVKEIGVVFQNPKTQFFMNEVFSTDTRIGTMMYSNVNNGCLTKSIELIPIPLNFIARLISLKS